MAIETITAGANAPAVIPPPETPHRTMNTESYVVRIYRRSDETASRSSAASTLVGVVEQPDNGTKRPFNGIDELWDILARPESPSRHESPSFSGNIKP